MRSWRDAARTILPAVSSPIAVAAALTGLGFALTIWVFYPGVMNDDARFIYGYATSGQYGDWQSPAMMALWALIDPLDPGAGSMFLLIASVYWLAFGVLASTIAQQSLCRGAVLVLLALSPPAFIFVGMIWRDVLFAAVWLGAAAMAFAVADCGRGVRVPMQAIAIGLLAFGVLLRPNAIIAAPILATFLLWPSRFSLMRAALVFAPAAVACFALVQIVYYGALDASREHPLHSIMVFDLGGITHLTKQNQFPGFWSSQETALLTERCYQPIEWNSYWTFEPCNFVMDRLEAANVFGSPVLVAAWREAVVNHPIAYLRHRATFMWTFLAGANQAIWTQDLDDPSKTVFADRPAFVAVKAVNDAMLQTPLLRAGTWLLLCAALGIAGWQQRSTPAGAFVLGSCGSAAVYVLTFAAVGVASDFRYAYWAVLAGLAGAVVIWPTNRLNRPRRRHSPDALRSS